MVTCPSVHTVYSKQKLLLPQIPHRGSCFPQNRPLIQHARRKTFGRSHIGHVGVRTLPAQSSEAESALSGFDRVPLAKGQLAEATLGDGSTLWLEAVGARGPRLQLLCYGELMEIISSTQPLEVRHKGFFPRLSDPWVRRCPGLADSLQKIRKQQQEGGSQLPSQLLVAHGVSQLRLVTSLDQFVAQVEQAPGLWCDGTGPEDPSLTHEQTTLLSAGELATFLQGARGVCALQLYKGWGDFSAALQPLLRPFVLQLLQQAAEDKGVLMLLSSAPEGLGTSLLLCPRLQPYKAWAEHLSKIGVQAALVADSPFYKLLVGRVLGYKEENIRHHIQSMGGSLDVRVIAAVDGELKGLSSAPAELPWKKARRR